MLLHGWQGFTHIDPIEGDVPTEPFGGRLVPIVTLARGELKERTRDEIGEMADEIARHFSERVPDEVGTVGYFYWLYPLPNAQQHIPQTEYTATLALMLADAALRLDSDAAAVAAIDAQEAITWVFVYGITGSQHEDFETALKNARSEAARKAAKERHRRTNELKDFAIERAVELKEELHEQNLQPSAYELADKICAKVERHGREVLKCELSEDRSKKTIHGWLLKAEEKGRL